MNNYNKSQEKTINYLIEELEQTQNCEKRTKYRKTFEKGYIAALRRCLFTMHTDYIVALFKNKFQYLHNKDSLETKFEHNRHGPRIFFTIERLDGISNIFTLYTSDIIIKDVIGFKTITFDNKFINAVTRFLTIYREPEPLEHEM